MTALWLLSLGRTGGAGFLSFVLGAAVAWTVVRRIARADHTPGLGSIVLGWSVGGLLSTLGASMASSADFNGTPGFGLAQFSWFVAMLATPVALAVLSRQNGAAEEKDRITANRQREIQHEHHLQRAANRLRTPTREGLRTGYEPAELAQVVLARPASMYGAPGAGLSGSGFDRRAIELGQRGELNFAKVLATTELLGRFATFWSVHMPSDTVGASERFSSDIDVVIVTGRSIWLIDLKYYKQGDVTWTNEGETLVCIDRATGFDVGEPRSMSRNMNMAHEVMAHKFRGLGVKHRVLTHVVFVPTDNGLGEIVAHWPGGIRAMGLPEMLTLLASEPAFDEADPDSEHIVRALRYLVKDESGSAAGAARHPAPHPAATPDATPGPGVDAGVPDDVDLATGPGRCPDCGEDRAAGAEFCYSCGAST